ncbi:MAG TPA: type I restriction endonuclease subunit R [Mesorhizobium sp.]|nr:type I restriction endonuclease subunit R [Mesorhizobium sp.]
MANDPDVNAPSSKSLFPPHDLATMNEDDVAGEIIRPFCRALGYSQGSPTANLRSQVTIRYDRVFLGHKGKNDPELRGRPDFICEVVSYARWVIEAKSPTVELTLADSQQAHTYATHPEIAAEFYLLTNGREFRLYRIGAPDSPFLLWQKDATEAMLPVLENVLGPEAIRKRATIKIDVGKPLFKGAGSTVAIVGGEIIYDEHKAPIPLPQSVNGTRIPVAGRAVRRLENGLISAEVEAKSPVTALDAIYEKAGFYPLTFKTSDEFISTSIESPTLLQNLLRFDFAPGTEFPETMFGPAVVLPFRIGVTCYTEAIGYVEGGRFRGVFNVEYEFILDTPLPMPMPKSFEMWSFGRFDLAFAELAG